MATNPPQLDRRADIDGLRAVAILPVILFHAGLPGLHGGYVGVDIFYVISGYLITRILWLEVTSTGKLRFGNFYARRARRLLPAAFLVIIATAAAASILYPPIERSQTIKSGLWSLFYVSNVHFWLSSTNYFQNGTSLDPYLHTWSLSIEEQFYLFWPLIILCTHWGRNSRRALVATMSAVFVLSLIACVVESYRVQPTAFYLLPFRAWEFAAGALAGMATTPNRNRAVAMAIAGVGAILVSLFAIPAAVTFPGIAATLPVLGTAALLVSGERDQFISSGLRHPTVRYIGLVSYSWYLWHWPVLLVGEDFLPYGRTLAVKLGLALLSLGMAAATYKWIEYPLRHNRFLTKDAWRTLIPTAAAMGVCATALFGMLGYSVHLQSREPYRPFSAANDDGPRLPAGCVVEFAQSEVKTCFFGQSPRDVVLFGDSHAEMWLPAVTEAARERGYRVVTILKSACPAADVPVFNPKIGRVETECGAWRNSAIERLQRLNPAAIIVASARSYVRSPNLSGGYATNSYADWADGYRRTLRRLPAKATILLVTDVPRFPFLVPWCLEQQAWTGKGNCAVSRNAAVDREVVRAEQSAAAGLRNVRFLDFTNRMCDSHGCRPTLGGLVAYRDSNHITASYAKVLTPEFCLALPSANSGLQSRYKCSTTYKCSAENPRDVREPRC